MKKVQSAVIATFYIAAATALMAQPVVTPPTFVPISPASPTVTSICTTQGSTLGGDTVNITGTNFSNATNVSFGPNSAGTLPAATSWWINSPTSITVSSPQGVAGVVDVTVTNPSGQSATSAADRFTYVAPGSAPTITSISPNNAPPGGGDRIFLVGTNLGSISRVNIGSTSISGGNLSIQGNGFVVLVTLPAGTAGTTVPVTATNSSGTSPTTCANQFTWNTNATTFPSVPAIPSTATRPAYNSSTAGSKWFVVGRGIYDSNGNLFMPIGANRAHGDQGSPDRWIAKPNIERNGIYFTGSSSVGGFGGFTSNLYGGMLNAIIPFHGIPVLMVAWQGWNSANPPNSQTTYPGTNCTCPTCTSIAILQNCDAPYYDATIKSQLQSTVLPGTSFTMDQIGWLDLSNEWGFAINSDPNPPPNTTFRSGIVAEVQKMRSNGYTAPIVVDAGAQGQGAENYMQDAVAIEAADPLHNVIFGLHVYNRLYWTSGDLAHGVTQLSAVIASLAQLTVPVFFEEWSQQACDNIGPIATPDQIMSMTVQYQLGWEAWAWDDNSSGGGCLLLGTDAAGTYCYANRSAFGTDVFTSATFGMQAASKQPTFFSGSPPAPPACTP